MMYTARAVGRYLVACRARGLSEKTITDYGWALAYLPDELPGDPAPLEDILAGLDLAPESRRTLWRMWRTFYRWATPRMKVRNALKGLRPPRIRRKFPRTFSQLELQRIWDACTSQRDQALHAVALDTGARLGEIAGLTWDRIGLGHITVDGKTGARTVPISSRTQQLLVGLGDDTHVWTGRKGPLTIYGVQQAFRRTFWRAGLDGPKLGPHTYRHTFGTESIRAGRNVFILQRIMGHSSIQTTMLYVHMVSEDLARDHEALSPLRLIWDRDDPTIGEEVL